jgi:hypothetical protein
MNAATLEQWREGTVRRESEGSRIVSKAAIAPVHLSLSASCHSPSKKVRPRFRN